MLSQVAFIFQSSRIGPPHPWDYVIAQGAGHIVRMARIYYKAVILIFF